MCPYDPHGPVIQWNPCLWRSLPSLDAVNNVQTLTLNRVQFATCQDFLAIVQALPNLRTLKMDTVAWTNSRVYYPGALVRPPLQKIKGIHLCQLSEQAMGEVSRWLGVRGSTSLEMVDLEQPDALVAVHDLIQQISDSVMYLRYTVLPGTSESKPFSPLRPC